MLRIFPCSKNFHCPGSGKECGLNIGPRPSTPLTTQVSAARITSVNDGSFGQIFGANQYCGGVDSREVQMALKFYF